MNFVMMPTIVSHFHPLHSQVLRCLDDKIDSEPYLSLSLVTVVEYTKIDPYLEEKEERQGLISKKL